MRVAILGDIHLGSHNDSTIFHDHAEKFFSDVFFPSLEKLGINKIVQLGDTWDRRKHVNFQTLKRAKEYLFNPVLERGLELITIIGNHDSFFKNSIETNSSGLLLSEYPNIRIVSDPTDIFIGDTKCSFIPWICQENREKCLDHIASTDSKILFGHLELNGFEMHRGTRCETGMDAELFKKFDRVLSGHFHIRANRGNVLYVGTPCDMTWNDYGDKKGFHILDTNSMSLEFIENTNKIFVKIEYDESSPNKVLPKIVRDKFVRVIVTNKADQKEFDKYIRALSDNNPKDCKIIEVQSSISQNISVDESVDLEDTLSILISYIDKSDLIDSAVDRDNIKRYMKNLYNEAQLSCEVL